MNNLEQALQQISQDLRKPLLEEYQNIRQAYIAGDWRRLGLSAGWFTEIVYTILVGLETGSFSSKPQKPKNMVVACQTLEKAKNLSRGLRVLIPRVLIVIYEARNNRGIGHAGADVDSNNMDGRLLMTSTSWALAELVRDLHGGSAFDAQAIVDSIVELPIPMIWMQGDKKRILVPSLSLEGKILVSLSSSAGKAGEKEVQGWVEVRDRSHYLRVVRRMHQRKLIEFDRMTGELILLPPGEKQVITLVPKV